MSSPQGENPVTEDAGLPVESLADLSAFFRALAHPTRASVLELLLGGERCVCELTAALNLSQPLVSHHLAILRNAGIVTMRTEGTRTYYAVDHAHLAANLEAFDKLIAYRRENPASVPAAVCARPLIGVENTAQTTDA
jgi:ArsR family transcriptional regulator